MWCIYIIRLSIFDSEIHLVKYVSLIIHLESENPSIGVCISNITCICYRIYLIWIFIPNATLDVYHCSYTSERFLMLTKSFSLSLCAVFACVVGSICVGGLVWTLWVASLSMPSYTSSPQYEPGMFIYRDIYTHTHIHFYIPAYVYKYTRYKFYTHHPLLWTCVLILSCRSIFEQC
jgi:hypothetical protein